MAGGPLVIPIVVCSFVLLLVDVRAAVRRSAAAAWCPSCSSSGSCCRSAKAPSIATTPSSCATTNPSLIAGVFAAAVRKWGKPAVEVEQAVLDEGERAANSMRKFLARDQLHLVRHARCSACWARCGA